VLVAVAALVITTTSAATEMQVIRTYNAHGVVISLLGPSGEWTTGENTFVMEFDSAPLKHLIDVGTPALMAALPIAGDQPLHVTARLARGDAVGRYIGTITLSRAGDWVVTVIFNSQEGKQSATFPVSAGPRNSKRKGALR
jgi:hypothetical protein